MRTCKKCGESKPLEDFKWQQKWRSHTCKTCEAARVKAYYSRHPDRKKRAYRGDYERNGEKRRAQVRRYASENAEVVRERKRDYHRRNPAVTRLHAHRRRGQLARPSAETRQWISLILADPCAYCDGPAEHVDHVIPLARGGEHDWTNLVSACGSCNKRKWARPLLQFLMEDR